MPKLRKKKPAPKHRIQVGSLIEWQSEESPPEQAEDKKPDGELSEPTEEADSGHPIGDCYVVKGEDVAKEADTAPPETIEPEIELPKLKKSPKDLRCQTCGYLTWQVPCERCGGGPVA